MRGAGDDAGAERLRERFLRRMWNLASFMQGVKQRYSQWFNARNDRAGTLWEERFKSVLVEGTGQTLSTMAAYIDLNPVRAGIVKDPADYRWSGYAEAVAGLKPARWGLKTVVMGVLASERPGETARKEMRRLLVICYPKPSPPSRRSDTSSDANSIRNSPKSPSDSSRPTVVAPSAKLGQANPPSTRSPELKPMFEQYAQWNGCYDKEKGKAHFEKAKAAHEKALPEWKEEAAKAKAGGTPVPPAPPAPRMIARKMSSQRVACFGVGERVPSHL
jgi:hypothetical protein